MVFMEPYGLPVRVKYEEETPMSKKTIGVLGIAKVISIALFLIPLYFILAYVPESSTLWVTANICSTIVLMLLTYHLFPFDPFDGYKIYAWKKGAWAGLFFPCLGLFLLHSFEVLPVGFLSLFGCIGLILFELSMFWSFRQYKERKNSDRIGDMVDIDVENEHQETLMNDERPPKKKHRKVIRKVVKIRAIKSTEDFEQ